MSKINRWFFVGTLTLCTILGYAQTNTNSPYSYYGLGNIETTLNGRTAGMGGVGIGMKSGSFINQLNPASYSGIDSLFFLFDVNVYGSSSRFESKQAGYNLFSGNLNKLAIGFRISSKVSASAGLLPFSNVGYKINTKKWVEGTTDYFNIQSKGKGGLNKVYLGGSYKINNHNSIGVNSSILFGSIERSEEYTYSLIDHYWIVTEKITSKPSLYFDLGYQYSNILNKNWNYTVGVIGGINSKMRFSKYINKETDTTTITNEELINSYNFLVPKYIGVGFTLSSEKWLFGADFRYQKWSSVKHQNDIKELTDSYKFATGAEYTPNRRLAKTFLQRLSYQAGFHFEQSYLQINGINLNDYGVSLGLGIPVRNQYSTISISFEAGRKGNYSNDLFREKYYQVNLSVNLSDIWFLRRKYN